MTRRRRPRTSEERLVAAVGSVARGVVGGRIRNVRQAPALERNTGGPVATGGFDPNADPVVIGAGADATGVTHAVVIGDSGGVGGDYAVAIGSSSNAGGIGSICLGPSAVTLADSAIAIGDGAKAYTVESLSVGFDARTGASLVQYGVAIGARTRATGDYCTAVGWQAGAGGTYSTAIGASAVATLAHQIVLGTASEFVEIPGNGLVLRDSGGGRWRLTVDTSGAPVWAAA